MAKKKTKATKTGRKVIVQKPVKRKVNTFVGDQTLSDGGFSDQFGKSKPPVLFNGLDLPDISLSATGPSAPLMQDFPNPTQEMDVQPYAVLSDFTNNPVPGMPAPPTGTGSITTDTLTTATASPTASPNGALSNIPVWVWILLILGVIFGVLYISKKK